MAKIVTTLTGIETKPGSKNGRSWVLSIFSAADGGDFSTLDGSLASKASSLLNRPVEVEYNESVTDRGYTRRTLNNVEAVGAGEVAVVVGETPKPAFSADAAPTFQTKQNDQFRTKEQIMRTDALQATLTLFGIIGLDPLSSADEFYGWFQSLYGLIEQGDFQTPDVRVEA